LPKKLCKIRKYDKNMINFKFALNAFIIGKDLNKGNFVAPKITPKCIK